MLFLPQWVWVTKRLTDLFAIRKVQGTHLTLYLIGGMDRNSEGMVWGCETEFLLQQSRLEQHMNDLTGMNRKAWFCKTMSNFRLFQTANTNQQENKHCTKIVRVSVAAAKTPARRLCFANIRQASAVSILKGPDSARDRTVSQDVTSEYLL